MLILLVVVINLTAPDSATTSIAFVPGFSQRLDPEGDLAVI